MVEHTRAHTRIAESDTVVGARYDIEDVLSAPIRVFVPERATGRATRLLIHFHGAPFIGEHATAAAAGTYIFAGVHLGAGSRAYERPFSDPAVLTRVIDAVQQAAGTGAIEGIVLSGFSAGYGAIRAILRDSANAARIEGVILLDGLHTSYVPEGTVLHQGGQLDAALLEPFVQLARKATAGERRMIITHSEIFPGTFASTTETTDHIIRALGLTRTPVLEWGPGGMQQLSRVGSGSLSILGFAGNTAPDHIDHFHALPAFLQLYDRMPLPADR
jgi:hypothetical protein